jgi:hypothetical protein
MAAWRARRAPGVQRLIILADGALAGAFLVAVAVAVAGAFLVGVAVAGAFLVSSG